MLYLNDRTLAEFKGQIVDIFEDFCDEMGITVENEDRDREDEDNLAVFYGDDYDAFGTIVEDFVEKKHLFFQKIDALELSKLAATLFVTFSMIVLERGNDNTHVLPGEEQREAFDKVSDEITALFREWNLLEETDQKEEKKEKKKGKKKTYIIAISSSEADDIFLKRVVGTETQVKKYLINEIRKDKLEDKNGFDYGSTTTKEISDLGNGKLYGYSVFSDYHIDYVAMPEEESVELE